MRRTVVVAMTMALVAIVPASALAQEEAPLVTAEPATELLIGQEIEVSVEGMPAGSSPTLSVCWALPVTGPGDCDLANFGVHTVTVGADGAGTGTYPLPSAPAERCAEEGVCFVVASAGIGAGAPHGGAPIVYAVDQPEPTTTTAAPTTTTAPPTTTTTAPATTTTAAPTTTEAPTGTTIAAVAADETDDDGSAPPIGPIVGGVLVLGAAALFFAIRADRRNQGDAT